MYSDVIFLLDEQCRINYASPSISRVLGYSSEEQLGQTPFELLHDNFQAEARQLTLELLASPGSVRTFEAWLKHKDGTWRWIEGVLSNRLRDGEVGALVLTCRDLTGHKRTEEMLRAQEGEFRTFFEMVGVGSAEVEPASGRFIRVNRKLTEISGYTADELLALGSKELTHPDDASRDWTLWQRCLTEGAREYTSEKRLLRKDGTSVWVQVTASFIRNTDGTPIRGALIVRDVTDRRHAVESLQRAREELERRVARRTAELATANQRLETLIAASPLSIISLEPDLIVRRWNPASEELFGWKEAEVLGKRLPILPHEDRDRYEQEVRGLLNNPRLRHLETVSQHRDGELLNVSIWRAPLYDAQSTLTGSMAIIMDITERNRLERALLDASERERRRIGQDLHDHLCQHLLGVACILKSLAMNAERQTPIRPGDLHHAAQLVNQSVQQTRDIARGLHPVELDAEGLMSALRELARQVSASVPCELVCTRPVLINDPDAAMHFYRIAQEAVTNSLKHAHASRLIIRLSEELDRIQLEIIDDGRGLENNGTRGRGMGLDIMKYRANAIGGSLKLETPPAGGTRVTCSIAKLK
ncbi:MAG: PAS domain S-box protein [Verrucomicrobiaceae bacterium]|nr:MAG: PAS domain S-box protein [Verrucomicrobiaceae bacterium]